MDAPDHLQHLRADTEALAATLREETVAAPVRACPGWDLRALAGHMGFIHRWAAAAVRTGSAPEPAAIGDAPSDVGELAAWVREGGRTLAGELAARDGDSPTWHPFPAPPVVSVWRRRHL